MNANSNLPSLEDLRALYDDIELAILFDWLEIERPGALAEIDLKRAAKKEETTAGPIRLMVARDGKFNALSLSNAAARFVLSDIQTQLPQWWGRDVYGELVQARPYIPPRRSVIRVLPRHLFTINWGDSGPGISWPESYYVAYLPGFERYLVTASQDSTDMYGYTDEAIGHFPVEEGIESGVRRVIRGWWKWLAEECSQERWAGILGGRGQIDAGTAIQCANEVWSSEEEEGDWDDDFEEDGLADN